MAKLPHLSETKLEELRSQVEQNLDRYKGKGFEDLAGDPGWSIELDVDYDGVALRALDGSDNRATTDLKNSKIVAVALGTLSPSLANEERIWARLAHVEGFEYCRNRWLKDLDDPEKLAAAVRTHFFAPNPTGQRDDHALSRLWWNVQIARQCYPQNADHALGLLLTTADVRSNLIERIWLMGRRRLATGVFRAMERHQFVLSSEKSFREFMKALNFLGGGVVFEVMSDAEIDEFLGRCVQQAVSESSSTA